AEIDVYRNYALVVSGRFAPPLKVLRSNAEQIQHADELIVLGVGLAQRAAKNVLRDIELILVNKALPERFVSANAVGGSAQRRLEFGDRFVDETHLAIGDAEVVVAFGVFVVDVGGYSQLEFRQHVLEVGLSLDSAPLIGR